jgi:hypothetical protein
VTLDTYLNDHLAGAAAGCELAAKLDERFRGTPRGTTFTTLHTAIEEDRATLGRLMDELGVPKQKAKQAMGWIGEKLTRLKLSEPLAGGPGLATLLEMETLGAGIQAKHALWQNLRALAGADPRLRGDELDRLVDRAVQQLDDLARQRVAHATETLLVDAKA